MKRFIGPLPYREYSYEHVHALLVKWRGPARAHACRCGRRADHWAYGPGGNGRPKSMDLSVYVPLCRACHKRLDVLTSRS